MKRSIESLNIDLAHNKARISVLVSEQHRNYLFAFGLHSAPSERVEKASFDAYWEAEETIQQIKYENRLIKEQLL